MRPGDSGAEFASVAVPVPVRRLFTYKVGEALRDSIAPGIRVRVPFGPRRVVGTVVRWPTVPPDPTVEVKPIESVLSAGQPLLMSGALRARVRGCLLFGHMWPFTRPVYGRGEPTSESRACQSKPGRCRG